MHLRHTLRRIGILGILVLACGLLPAARAIGASEGESLPAPDDRSPITGRFPVEITLSTPGEMEQLYTWDLDIATVRGSVVTAYVDDRQQAVIRQAGLAVRAVPNQARRAYLEMVRSGREDYHTYATLTTELQQIAAAHPDICQLFSIGQSVEGRELWMMKISDNVTVDEPEPEIKYSSTMHGNEVVGMEMCVYFIRLLVNDYGIDPAHTALANDLEFFICPLHNPDGNYHGVRENAQGYDLNREFPDPVDDPNDSPVGRPTEVQHMMNFQYAHNSILGINYHGGAKVVNYPWDSMYGQYTPDDTLIRNLSLGYSYRNPPMWNSGEFLHGVTIGWEWYVIYGGMQDWAYNWRNELHVTIELDNDSWPPSSRLPQLWIENRDAMLWWAAQARIGVEGFVTDALDGSPVKATIDVTQIGKDVWGEPLQGYYHRMLEPGTYTIEYRAFGYAPTTLAGVTVTAGTTTHRDVQLARTGWYAVSGTVTDAGTGAPLAATVSAYRNDTGEFFASAATDPGTGGYTLSVPGWEYDFVARAADHVDQTQTKTVSSDTIVDFALAEIRGYVLLVKDNNPSPFMVDDLAAIGYQVIQEAITDTDPVAWPDYDLLIWSAGSYRNPVASPTLRAALESYVAAGHRLLIEGGEIGYDALVNPGYASFAQNVLHVSAWHADDAGHLQLRPEQGSHPLATTPNALPQTIQLTYDYFGDEDAVTPRPEAAFIYKTTTFPNDAGILVVDLPGRTTGQIAFYPFDYNALTSRTVAADLLENTVAYLRGGGQGIPVDGAPTRLALGRPAPTPTTAGTTLRLELPRAGNVRVALYDVAGRQVAALWDGLLAAGTHALTWDGRDARGATVAPGVYFLRAVTAGEEATRRLVVLR
jgi:carboxypeptidase D